MIVKTISVGKFAHLNLDVSRSLTAGHRRRRAHRFGQHGGGNASKFANGSILVERLEAVDVGGDVGAHGDGNRRVEEIDAGDVPLLACIARRCDVAAQCGRIVILGGHENDIIQK